MVEKITLFGIWPKKGLFTLTLSEMSEKGLTFSELCILKDFSVPLGAGGILHPSLFSSNFLFSICLILKNDILRGFPSVRVAALFQLMASQLFRLSDSITSFEPSLCIELLFSIFALFTSDILDNNNGFELLMASYAMAHLKLDLLLTETGYTPTT